MATEASVTPIFAPIIDWSIFLKDTASVLSRKITQTIDATDLKLTDYAKFLITLRELRDNKKANPIDALRDSGILLRHLHFGFIIGGSTKLILKISELSKLCITSTQRSGKGRLALISGDLGEWKVLIHEFKKVAGEAEWVAETLLDFFSHLGLRCLFDISEFRRIGTG